jgi:hypothetical protein
VRFAERVTLRDGSHVSTDREEHVEEEELQERLSKERIIATFDDWNGTNRQTSRQTWDGSAVKKLLKRIENDDEGI